MRARTLRFTPLYKVTHGLIDINIGKCLIQHSKGLTRGSLQFKLCAINHYPVGEIHWKKDQECLG